MSADRKPEIPVNQTNYRESTESFLEYNGVNPRTHAFLLDCIKYDAHQSIDTRGRNLIGLYYGTTMHLQDLQPLAGVGTYQGVKRIIMTRLAQMRECLPPEVQAQYPPKETFLTKSSQAPIVKEKRDPIIKSPEYLARLQAGQRRRREKERQEESLQTKV